MINKFKLYDIKKKEMITQDNTDRIDKIPVLYEKIPKCALLRYTTMNDFSNNEIYEGDILSGMTKSGKKYFVVEWVNYLHHTGWIIKCRNENFHLRLTLGRIISREFRIIGNVCKDDIPEDNK